MSAAAWPETFVLVVALLVWGATATVIVEGLVARKGRKKQKDTAI